MAPRIRRCPVICPNTINLHSQAPVGVAALDLNLSHALPFTIIPGTSPARLFIKAITTKWFTRLIQTWHGAITPHRLPVLPTDMRFGIMTHPLSPSRDNRGLYLLISDSPHPQFNGTTHITAPVVSHDKLWMNSSIRGIGAVSWNPPGPVLSTARERLEWSTCRCRSRHATRAKGTRNR